MSDDNRDRKAQAKKQPARSGSIPGPTYENPNEDQQGDKSEDKSKQD